MERLTKATEKEIMQYINEDIKSYNDVKNKEYKDFILCSINVWLEELKGID